MKKSILLFVICVIVAMPAISQNLTVDEIINKYFKAVGQEKIIKIKSIKSTGKQMIQSMNFSFVMFQSRPNKMRVEVETNGVKIVQAINGETGFMINPMTGSNDPQDLPENQMEALKAQSDIDGILYNYKEKGLKIESAGSEYIGKDKAYKLKVAKGENISYYYIDTKSFLISKITAEKEINGMNMNIETRLSDYRDVQGIKIAYVTESVVNNMTATKVTIDNVVLNAPIPDSLFNK